MIRSLPLLALLVGCVTETGNPEMNVELRVSGTTTDDRVAVDGAPDLIVAAAWILVEEVRLVEADGCDSSAETEHRAEGPFPVDLVGTPTLVNIPAADADYCRLRVRLGRAEGEEGLPAGMSDHAVYIEGTRADGVPFVLRSRDEFEVDLRSSGSFAVTEGRERLLLAFDLGSWLGGLDFAGATVSGDGTVHVDDYYNDDLLDAFEERVEEVMDLFEDDDGDGMVGPYDTPIAG